MVIIRIRKIISTGLLLQKNNSGFIIERSPTGLQFEPIGNVEGNGTTNQNSDYRFIDVKPFEGVNYYRLKQLDENEQFTYSSIIAINSGVVSNNQVIVNNEIIKDNNLDLTIFLLLLVNPKSLYMI